MSGDFVEDNTLTVYVRRLRKKLGDAVPIITVRGDRLSCGSVKKKSESFLKEYKKLWRVRNLIPGMIKKAHGAY
nr:winged helix-turn-helix domain-containing protein [uncultured Blautia sp.]